MEALALLERRQQRVERPGFRPGERGPGRVLGREAPRPGHEVQGRGPPEDLAPGRVHFAVVGVDLRDREERPAWRGERAREGGGQPRAPGRPSSTHAGVDGKRADQSMSLRKVEPAWAGMRMPGFAGWCVPASMTSTVLLRWQDYESRPVSGRSPHQETQGIRIHSPSILRQTRGQGKSSCKQSTSPVSLSPLAPAPATPTPAPT